MRWRKNVLEKKGRLKNVVFWCLGSSVNDGLMLGVADPQQASLMHPIQWSELLATRLRTHHGPPVPSLLQVRIPACVILNPLCKKQNTKVTVVENNLDAKWPSTSSCP